MIKKLEFFNWKAKNVTRIKLPNMQLLLYWPSYRLIDLGMCHLEKKLSSVREKYIKCKCKCKYVLNVISEFSKSSIPKSTSKYRNSPVV